MPPSIAPRGMLATTPVGSTWQQVHVVLDTADGKRVHAVLLHSDGWLRARRVAEGRAFTLDLPEQNVHGEGRVTRIEPSPMASDGEGRLMTFVRHAKPPDPSTGGSNLPSGPREPTYFGERICTSDGWEIFLEFKVAGGEVGRVTWTRSQEWESKHGAAFDKLKGRDGRKEDGDWCLVRLFLKAADGNHVNVAVLQPQEWVRAYDLMVGEVGRLRLRQAGIEGEARLVAIDPAPAKSGPDTPWGYLLLSKSNEYGGKALEEVELGEGVTTYTPEERGKGPQAEVRCEALSLYRIFVRLDKPRGWVDVGLLRDEAWVQTHGARPGSRVFLNLPEMGARGWAQVEAVEPCLVFRWGDRRLVTGTFHHSAGLAGDLKLKGEPEPLGVTASHLIWSVDRQDWVAVVELRPGETVKTLNGTTTVESYRMRAKPEPVYNIEVERDHCYRVGQQGLLVHNASATNDPKPKVLPCEGRVNLMLCSRSTGILSQHTFILVTDPSGKRTAYSGVGRNAQGSGCWASLLTRMVRGSEEASKGNLQGSLTASAEQERVVDVQIAEFGKRPSIESSTYSYQCSDLGEYGTAITECLNRVAEMIRMWRCCYDQANGPNSNSVTASLLEECVKKATNLGGVAIINPPTAAFGFRPVTADCRRATS